MSVVSIVFIVSVVAVIDTLTSHPSYVISLLAFTTLLRTIQTVVSALGRPTTCLPRADYSTRALSSYSTHSTVHRPHCRGRSSSHSSHT